MTSFDLPPSLIRFIHSTLPTYQAAEVLLFFAAHPEQALTAEELVIAIRPSVLTMPAAKQYCAIFVARGLIVEREGAYQYHPASGELEQRIGELTHAYNERPVTLIKAIYSMADGTIRSFADAFDFRKE